MPDFDLSETLDRAVSLGKELAAAEVERKTQFVVQEHNGRPFWKGDFRPMKDPEADTLSVNTLTALVDYLAHNPDGLELDKLLVHVNNATDVAIRSIPTGPHLQRPVFMRATALVPDHMYDRFVGPDSFVPYLQSCFAEGGDLETVIAICSNLSAQAEVGQTDDGLSQTVTARVGVQRKTNIEVPNPVVLYPFSSFVEIMQPARKFVLRFKGSPDEGASCKLMAADGGAWQIAAIEEISKWLREKLPEGVRVIA
ncbi:hypothetical protein [Desulfovibrio psychrotolerans]|uniref:Uncharacterized protein n=1 Tax=Desulfovibrio psychrotolerans TaxID=415242 RepID=A0A7J0BYN5_9BACT|nr:hypothetical protein [Desulfovibrio psychrotolerans]GFM38282.1 hypothetical protein DSM19430T_29660 [Desulfovibrio psychrotolerans]